jgi:hypothetical protein
MAQGIDVVHYSFIVMNLHHYSLPISRRFSGSPPIASLR